MNRKEFIVSSCAACISGTVISSLLSSCTATKYLEGKLGNDGLTIAKASFKVNDKTNSAYRSFIIVRNEELQYPICIYRFNENEYTALWMRCTHQGAELQASGDYLQCPAHGSEFNNKGIVTNGPAGADLRSFPITVTDEELFIDLRKKG
jgi:nitrite reductase/ring-hydroxylating ferredoxin subunit